MNSVCSILCVLLVLAVCLHLQLVPRGLCSDFDEAVGQFTAAVPPLASFIHLHAGIDATDLPTYAGCIQEMNTPNEAH